MKPRLGQKYARFPSNFDVMDVNLETKNRMRGRTALQHDFMVKPSEFRK